MIVIANEVANAGIGVDIGIRGLNELVKTNDVLQKMRYNAQRLQNVSVDLTTRVTGSDALQKVLQAVKDLHHQFTSNVDVHTSGENSLEQMRQNIEHTQSDVQKLKHAMNISGSVNTGNSGISRLNGQVGRLKSSMNEMGRDSRSSFNKVDEGANSARDHTMGLASTGMKLHGIFSGTFLGQQASNAFQHIEGGAKSAVKEGIQLVETGDQVKSAWQHIGVGNNNANDMVEQMDQLRDSAGMDEESIQRMQRSMYTLTGSAPRARSLTNEMVAFGKASGDSSDQIGRMGRTLPRLLSSSKVRATMFNRTLGQSPALVNAIAKASGHSKKSFQALLQSGKITSQQLQQYMQSAAKGSGHAMDQFYSTLKGQIQAFKGMWTSAKEDFSKPFVSNLSRAMNQTEHSAGGLRQLQTTVAKLSTTLGTHVGNFVGKAIGFMVKNRKPLIKIGTSLFRILKAIGSGVWKEFTSILTSITGGSQKSGKSLNHFADTLAKVASHTKQLQRFGRVLLNIFIISKINKFNRFLAKTFKQLTGIKSISGALKDASTGLGKAWVQSGEASDRIMTSLQIKTRGVHRAVSDIQHPILATRIGFERLSLSSRSLKYRMVMAFYSGEAKVKAFTHSLSAANIKEKLTSFGAKSLRFSLQSVGTAVRGIGFALDSIPLVGWIQLAIDGITEIYMHSAKFRRLVNPLLKGIGHMIGWIGDKIADGIEGIIKASKWVRNLAGKVSGLFHHTKSAAASTSSSMNRYTRNSASVYRRSQKSDTSATRRAHKAIDRYRSHSNHQFRAYISKSGRLYKNYHKGTTRISETTYKQREALRRRYYARYESNLKKYESNYRKYERKRSSLSRKYGKLRAMYSAKSLTLIETRFKKLRNLVVRYSKTMFKRTQYWFRKIGTGAGRQFRGIYRSVRKYLHMSNREAVKDFKTLARNSKRWLNGSVHKYVSALRYRFKRQRYYDRQLVRQAKKTATAMYHLPVGWITRETKDLIRNWRRQRSSFITHNKRMTHAEVSHISTMDEHLRRFRDRFEDMMSDLEDNIYKGWSKFWDEMHDRTGSGINSVEKPLNSGATNINSFVRAFGETSSPMHTMPMVSYASGTGMRRPINQMVQATLNDGHDSPETNNQETVIRPNGSVEFPKGQNVQELLEPGTEVLNATETKLMGQMAHFAPTVHLATGTGLFGGLFGQMSSWIKNALSGTNSGTSYSTIWNQAKGSGYHKLLHVLQAVLGHSEQILSGFMGNAPKGYNGVLGDIVQGIYGQTSNQIDQWWKVLMSLTNQSLNNGTSSSDILNYAEKNWMGVPYSYSGGSSQSSADCGGAVMSILRHFGINITHTDMEDSPAVRFVGTSQSDARPGDLVMFGKKYGAKSGYNSHVGIYAGNGQMWNECPPKSMMSPVSSGYGDGLWGYYRLRNAPSNNNNSLGNIKTNNSLGRFVKQQEAPMFKWIEKHLEPLLEPANPGGAGVARWRPYVEKALKANGFSGSDSQVAAWMRVIQRESNGDPHAVNNWDSNAAAGIPSKGLVQTIGPTFDSNAFPGHHDIFNGYDDLLAGIHYMAEKYGRGDSAFARVSGPEGYAKGGRFHAGQLMTVGEHGAELIKPDVSGEVIPHNETKRIMNNNSSHPVKVEQHNTFNVNGDASRSTIHEVDSHIDKANDTLADKLSRLMGFTEGGRVI